MTKSSDHLPSLLATEPDQDLLFSHSLRSRERYLRKMARHLAIPVLTTMAAVQVGTNLLILSLDFPRWQYYSFLAFNVMLTTFVSISILKSRTMQAPRLFHSLSPDQIGDPELRKLAINSANNQIQLNGLLRALEMQARVGR